MSTQVTVYGIPNCDTMKKARAWLTEHGVDYEFHDYKKQGVTEPMLRAWIGRVGWEPLVNRRGMTFRKLPDDEKVDLNEDKAIRLMIGHPSLIKRPVVVTGDNLLVGFDLDQFSSTFG